MNWYDKVSKDISNIPDAAAYYEAELIEAKQDVRIAGNIEKASSQMPGIVEERFNQLQPHPLHSDRLVQPPLPPL